MMIFTDLTDADYEFRCDFSGDACEYWDYDFTVERWDDKYSKNLSREEIEQLRENCRKILRVTEGC
jgi:hypothetical protein